MNGKPRFSERARDLGVLSCGCSTGVGLLILGSCAGTGAGALMDDADKGMLVAISILAAVVILALVYVIAKRNAELRIARARLAEQSKDSEPLQ